MSIKIQTGLDNFLKKNQKGFRAKKIGLIAHQASVTKNLVPAITALSSKKAPLKVIFAPEHGFNGTIQDQIEIPSTKETQTGLPLISLYGNKRTPALTHLKDLDALIFDLQDIGVRYYTFIWTMLLAMQTAAKTKTPFVVLDRPNPLGGRSLEGNILNPHFSSFVGLHPLPVRHGMTTGELALCFKNELNINLDLTIIKMSLWKRSYWFDHLDTPWVSPSPNMPTLDTATVYAGSCLFEATNLSEGRGTTRPFELIGAPFISADKITQYMNSQKIPGALFRPTSFLPTFHKWAEKVCHGVQIHVENREIFPSFLTGLILIQGIRRLWPRHFKWRPPPYEYETKKLPFDILCGTDLIRKHIEKDHEVKKLKGSWTPQLKKYYQSHKVYFLYNN